jgi:hypothetical protein
VNKDIIVGGNKIKWIALGACILCIYNIIHERMEFLMKSDLEGKYNIVCDDMRYNMIKSVIPNQ